MRSHLFETIRPAHCALVLAIAFTVLSPLATTRAAAQDRAARASVDLPAELDRVLRDYESAWRARDAARLASLFDDDGFVLSPGKPPVRGRSAIQANYTGSGGPLRLSALAHHADGTAGYIIGLYGTVEMPDAGKFVLALRRSAPSEPWSIAADMDSPNAGRAQPAPAADETLVRRLFDEAWSAGDYANLPQLVAPDLQFHFRGRVGTMSHEQFRNMVNQWRGAFPDLRFAIEDVVSAGDRVAARMTFTGTHRGALMGMEPTGRTVTVTMMVFARIANGRIAELWEDYDEHGMRQQLTRPQG
jgi:steroid delta-isomerase-like uncharacterized protein